MGALDIVIGIFIFLELSNILIIYFKPEFKYGNGMVVFKQWEELKEDEKTALFARYMANWVAGSKVVFVALLAVMLIVGSETVKFWAVVVMVPAIATYYFKLHPLMKRMDDIGELKPKGYSKQLVMMISVFIGMFILA